MWQLVSDHSVQEFKHPIVTEDCIRGGTVKALSAKKKPGFDYEFDVKITAAFNVRLLRHIRRHSGVREKDCNWDVHAAVTRTL